MINKHEPKTVDIPNNTGTIGSMRGPQTGRSITDGEKKLLEFDTNKASVADLRSTVKYTNILGSNFGSVANLHRTKDVMLECSRDSSLPRKQLAWKHPRP